MHVRFDPSTSVHTSMQSPDVSRSTLKMPASCFYPSMTLVFNTSIALQQEGLSSSATITPQQQPTACKLTDNIASIRC
eukprot:357773-Chlamydomonas_euryale.AAC.9